MRAEAEAARAEAGRTKAAEVRFERLLAWAREEERRRLLAEETLERVSAARDAAGERGKALEMEVSQGGVWPYGGVALFLAYASWM